jgi:hypothetical protein
MSAVVSLVHPLNVAVASSSNARRVVFFISVSVNKPEKID